MTSAPPLPLWPQPITHRPPTEADADEHGKVQWLNEHGRWGACGWEEAARDGDPWLHTPRWRPRITREAALEALDALTTATYLNEPHHAEEAFTTLRTYLNAQP